MAVESLQLPIYDRTPQPIQWTKSWLDKLNIKVNTWDQFCQFVGEVIGTAMLVFLGCTGCVQNDHFVNSPLQSSLNVGLVVMMIVHCFGCVCGAHLNPAITLAVYIYDMISLTMAGVFFLGQLLGAFAGYALMKALVPADAISLGGAAHGVCVPTPHPDITTMQGFWIEFIATAMLIFTTCSAADSRNMPFQDSLPIRFGLTVACLSLAVGQLSGAMLNPVKAVAAAVWNSDYQDHWIYWAAPMLSALVSATFYKVVFKRDYVERELNEKP
ncbi:aquaporin AQPAn.G-like isoform X1 [Anastrepha obliqua]|uniref:aquaporin AQPAn.G-like isoform X1 n=2 Tax=Anastrepha obliqua TaxID=95512 RepID=UPI00240901B9|nr:aquaporin AQPAn.G-like isoform X1 [Anastrepha obliqua]